MADVSRGDIVTRGGLSFVVWVHGQGETAAMPIKSGKVDHRKSVTFRISDVVNTGIRIPDDQITKLREIHADYVMSDHSAWDEAPEQGQEFFNDGRYHAPVYNSDDGYWVQRTRASAE